MHIETKFNLGQYVVPITRRHETLSDPCPTCDGTGRVELVKGGTAVCPEDYVTCRDGRVNHQHIHPWAVDSGNASLVGRIDLTRFSEYEQGNHHKDETRYMISATGIGSGRLWQEADLFATVEEAQAECDRRNAIVPAEAI